MESIVVPPPPIPEYSRGQTWLWRSIQALEGGLLVSAFEIIRNILFDQLHAITSRKAPEIFYINMFTAFLLVLLLPRSVIHAEQSRSSKRTHLFLTTASCLIILTCCILARSQHW